MDAMPEPLADLHTHTTRSDGRRAPADLVRRAHEAGLCAIAVTDHDTLEGWPEAAEAGATCGLTVVPGVELSVQGPRREVHLLGYFFDAEHPALRAFIASYRDRREERARAMVARLNAEGQALSFDAVQALSGDGVIGRPHVAQALLDAGHVATYEEAFDRFLGDGAPAAVPKELPPAEEALALLHDAGGIGVLAHPGHWTADRDLMTLIRAGLDGIETMHPSHDAVVTRYYRRLARDFGLIETGGSDYHGLRPQDEDNLGRYGVSCDRLHRMAAGTHAGIA